MNFHNTHSIQAVSEASCTGVWITNPEPIYGTEPKCIPRAVVSLKSTLR